MMARKAACAVMMLWCVSGCDPVGGMRASRDDVPKTPSIVSDRPKDKAPPQVAPDKKPARKTPQTGPRWWGDALDKIPVPKRGNQRIKRFTTAKRTLLEQVHEGHHTTFYCECRYDMKKAIDLGSCGYKVRKNAERARRVEYEHVVPASALGRKIDAWSKGDPKCLRSNGKPFKGRKCAQKVSPEFRRIEADMYNLQPSVGEVNGDRLNHPMGEIPGEARAYGKCDVEVQDRVVEPAPRIRGDVARTYLYMDWAYPSYNLLSPKEVEMFQAWSKADPPDVWEKERAKRIGRIQGNNNPFVR